MGCIQLRGAKKDIVLPECVICFNTAENILWPCGHFCLCNSCASNLATYNREINNVSSFKLDQNRMKAVKCPICRKVVLPTKFYMNEDL